MVYVGSITTIPIPRVIETHLDGEDNETGWILMEFIPGKQLGEAWPTLRLTARTRAITELRSYLEQLHGIRPPSPGWIGSCLGGPAYDHRLDNISTCGPFASVAPIKNYPRPERAAYYRNRLSEDFPIVFAHADISWENILVNPMTGAITGIIDWEMAGFWPEWWEYRKALFASRSKSWWIDIVDQIMPESKAVTDIDMDLEMY